MTECPASIARRIASMLYESLLLTGVLLLTLLLPHLLIGAFTQHVASAAILWAHLFLVLLVYFVGFWRHGGQTLAMKTWHIRLVSRDRSAISTAQAFRRFLWCWPTLVFGGVGLIWALFDRDRQFLHDRLAGTRLISTR